MSKTKYLLLASAALGLIFFAWSIARPLNPWGISKGYPLFLVVDRSEFKLYTVEKGVPTKVFPVVVGKPRTKTPLGRWRVARKLKFEKLGIYGLRKLELDRLVRSKYVPTIYAIHGTNHEELLREMPRMFSNGCVRVYNKDIAYLWRKVPTGTPVEVIP